MLLSLSAKINIFGRGVFQKCSCKRSSNNQNFFHIYIYLALLQWIQVPVNCLVLKKPCLLQHISCKRNEQEVYYTANTFRVKLHNSHVTSKLTARFTGPVSKIIFTDGTNPQNVVNHLIGWACADHLTWWTNPLQSRGWISSWLTSQNDIWLDSSWLWTISWQNFRWNCKYSDTVQEVIVSNLVLF